MAKVTVIKSFIGTAEEVEKFGGKVPSDIEHADRMTDDEKASFKSIITRGTVIDVDDKRAKELIARGVVGDGSEKDKKAPAKQANEKVADVQVKDEKSKNAGPGKK